MDLTKQLQTLANGQRLSLEENEAIFLDILDSDLAEVQVSALLMAWRIIGEQCDELLAGARVMRTKSSSVTIPAHLRPLCDNCGTGGDGSNTFNISTASAVVAASCGVHMAKHGNRSVSSKCGSADLLFAAGFPENMSASNTIKLLEKTGLTFFFAPNFHPSLKPIMGVRRILGIRTIFNLLGPLANPVHPEFQLIGVGNKQALRPVAEALAQLGVERALVAHSRDGLDEISVASLTDAFFIEDKRITPYTVDPAELGVSGSLEGLRGGDVAFNLKLLKEFLDGRHPDIISAVALNAGAVIWLSRKAGTLGEGIELARSRIEGRLAREFFRGWIDTAQAIARSKT